MRFTVIWDNEVETSFVRTWVAADSQMRATLTEVANWVDTNLSVGPESKGQSRPDLGARIVAVPLLNSPALVSVSYEVWTDDRLVHVIRLTFRNG